MTARQRILSVLRGQIPDRVPVSLCKIDPYDTSSFWAQHKSFHPLLERAREVCDTFIYYRPKTGFFFSSPGAIDVEEERQADTPGSETVTLRVRTEKGVLERTARTSRLSAEQWVLKPWIDSHADFDKFLSLPFSPYAPDISALREKEREYGERAVFVIPLPTPVGVAGVLFAPGELSRFLLEEPKKVELLLDRIFDRLAPLYQSLAQNVMGAVIRLRGSEYLTPPTLPPGHFPNYREIFNHFVIRYDTRLVNLLRQGNFNFVCYHWHDIVPELLPMVLKMAPDVLEPVINTRESPDMVATVKRVAGPELTLMGGLSLEDLDFRTPDEVESMTRNVLRQGAKNGRFILIPANVPSAVPFSPQTEENFFRFIDVGVKSSYPFS